MLYNIMRTYINTLVQLKDDTNATYIRLSRREKITGGFFIVITLVGWIEKLNFIEVGLSLISGILIYVCIATAIKLWRSKR